MSWFRLNDDERRELRNSVAGKALLEEIEAQITMARDEVVTTMLDEAETAANHARRIAGRVDGMEAIKHIIERDP